MILYGFMVRYGENNRWGPGRPPPVVFRQNEMPWLLGLKMCLMFLGFLPFFHLEGFYAFVINQKCDWYSNGIAQIVRFSL